ncbi:MAG: aldo/keto reductase [Armatimonadota bacterium]|nr:MAG: aldo/keto reductase [Armatimonadota bacterium]
MPVLRKLGSTGLRVTPFTMGGIGAQTNVLKAGLARGINFIHCAQGYGTLDRVADAIAGRRDKLILGLKYERAGRADWEYLDRSLEALRADHVDILFFPLNSPDAARDRQHLEFFRQVKQRNKARFIGITTHSNVAPTMQAAVEAGFWQVLMPSYVPSPEARAALRPVLDQAEKKKLGVVAMKTMAGIQPNAVTQMQTALKQVLADTSVSTLVKGMLTFELLEAFLAAAASVPTKVEKAELEQHLASCRGESCVLCGDCPSCPRGISVFDVMRTFAYYYAQAGAPQFARAEYRAIPAAASGKLCDDCGACTAKCPYGVDIARHVRAAHLVLA